MDSTIKGIWKNCLEEAGKHISPQHYARWFKPIKVTGGDEHTIELEVPNRFFLEWLKDHYLPLIQDIIGKNTKKDFLLNWRISEGNGDNETTAAISKESASASKKKPSGAAVNSLHPKYTFENFVVGKANEFAHAACSA